ncbi:VOC family protein [Streptomyces sp. NPDC055952]|uniref:VOC family protein n=1 Tax=Streptomyces sp. NPDC055952 TaxID=3345663 RepID=UPI0035D5F2A3
MTGHGPRTALHAYLSYRDADAALKWLTDVGFEVVTRQDGPGNTVIHSEVRYGEAVLMIASADADYDVPPLKGGSTGAGLYLWMPEPAAVDDWHRQAIAAGAQDVIAPEDTPWGSRRARVLDREGHEWSAGTYRPGDSW